MARSSALNAVHAVQPCTAFTRLAEVSALSATIRSHTVGKYHDRPGIKSAFWLPPGITRPVLRITQHKTTHPWRLNRCHGTTVAVARHKEAGPTHATWATALRCPRCPQHGPRSLLPSPSHCLLLHYLKHTLVFICRAGDVASSSTFPSRPVYIREPIWLYKTRQRKGGGPEP